MFFNVYKNYRSNEIGFLHKTIKVFEKFNISIGHILSRINSISVVISKEAVEKYQYDIIMEIKYKIDAEVKIVNDISLLAVVGRNLAKKSGIYSKIFETLGTNGIKLLNYLIKNHLD